MPTDRTWLAEVASLLEARAKPEDFPPTLVTMQEFRQTLAQALAESRTTSEPFAVLLFSIRAEEAPAGFRELLRTLGLHIIGNLRTTFNPHYPPRKLDVVSWWGNDFVAICFNADRELSLIPAQRVIANVDRGIPPGDRGTIRVVAWGWSWRSGNVSEVSILRQLREELKADPQDRIVAVPEVLSPLEQRVRSIMERLQWPH